MRKLRLFLWIAVVVVAGLSLGLVMSDDVRNALTGTGDEQGVAAVGGSFTLVTDEGETVTEADFEGRPTAYFFGFTHCPDVCPTTLFEMSTWLEALGDDADDLNVVFVTVDPERDGQEEMARYLDSFDERIVGLTGEPDAVEEMTKAWRVYVAKVPVEEGSDEYTVDHTASVFLMDAEGEFFGTIGFGEDEEMAVGKLRRLVAG